jgi:hypothetical protein
MESLDLKEFARLLIASQVIRFLPSFTNSILYRWQVTLSQLRTMPLDELADVGLPSSARKRIAATLSPSA